MDFKQKVLGVYLGIPGNSDYKRFLYILRCRIN